MIPKSKCITCKKELWDDSPPLQPKKGDHVTCIYCGCIMDFDKNLLLVKPKKITPEMYESSLIIQLLNIRKANPFNGDPDKFNVRSLLFPFQS